MTGGVMDPVRELVARWREHADSHGGRGEHAAEDTLNECASELEAALAASGWRSMDSAPRDGTDILLWLRHPFSEVVIRRWSDEFDCWLCPDDNHQTGCRVPTAWMPLPPPPGDDR